MGKRWMIGALLVALPGCLEPREGGLQGAQDVEAGVAEDPCRSRPARPLEMVAGHSVDAFALGACGDAAWIAPVEAQPAVTLRSGAGAVLGTLREDAGWFQGLRFAADGAHLAVEIGRSDLGFGDWLAYPADGLAAERWAVGYQGRGASGFFGAGADAGAWVCDSGYVGGGPSELVVTSDARTTRHEISCGADRVAGGRAVGATADGQLLVVALATGEARAVAAVSEGWVDGDTLRWRDRVQLSPDGRWLVIGTEEEGLGLGDVPAERRASLVRVLALDEEPPVEVASASGFGVDARFQPGGHAVAWPDGDGGVTWVAPDGTLATLEQARLLDVLRDGRPFVASGPADEPMLALAEGDPIERIVLAEAARDWERSPGDAQLAWIDAAGQAWRRPLDGGPATRLDLAPGPLRVHHVTDEGATVLGPRAPDDAGQAPVPVGTDALIAAPGGTVTWTRERARVEGAWSTAHGVLLTLAVGVQHEVVLVRPETGAATTLVEAHDPSVRVDAAGRRAAIAAIPVAGTSRALWVGALAAP